MELPRLDASILAAFRALGDHPKARVVGQAVTLLNRKSAERRAAEVLALAQRLATSEEARLKKLAAGIPLAEFIKLPR